MHAIAHNIQHIIELMLRNLLMVVCCLLLLAGCPKSAAPLPNPLQEIRFAIAQAPLNLDPRYATDAASERVNRLIYQPLVDFDTASQPAWLLARGDAINKKNYRFILQKKR